MGRENRHVKYTDEYLDKAHEHCKDHRQDVEAGRCACFHCLRTFDGSEVCEWIDRGRTGTKNTAMCPHCRLDMVLPAARGLPIDDPEFLKGMRRMWVETTHTAEEVRELLAGRESAPPS